MRFFDQRQITNAQADDGSYVRRSPLTIHVGFSDTDVVPADRARKESFILDRDGGMQSELSIPEDERFPRANQFEGSEPKLFERSNEELPCERRSQ